MSHRPEQMASEVRNAVQQLIDRGLSDPRIEGMITITEAKVSPDCKTAFLSVSVLPAERQELTMHGLKAAAVHIRREAGKLVRTRQVPELVFRLDASLKKQADVFRSIGQAAADLERRTKAGLSQETDPAYPEGRPPTPEEPRS